MKFNCAKNKVSKNTDIPGQGGNSSECICTGYRRTEEHTMGASNVLNISAPQSPVLGPLPPSPVIDLSRFNPEEFPMEVRKKCFFLFLKNFFYSYKNYDYFEIRRRRRRSNRRDNKFNCEKKRKCVIIINMYNNC